MMATAALTTTTPTPATTATITETLTAIATATIYLTSISNKIFSHESCTIKFVNYCILSLCFLLVRI